MIGLIRLIRQIGLIAATLALFGLFVLSVLSALSTQEHGAAFVFGIFLDGVAQHGARHSAPVSVDKRAQACHVALAGLAQHPAHGLVHQVMGVVHQQNGEAEGVVQVVVFYEGVGRYHGYAVVPKQGAGGQPVEHVARLVDEICADNLRRGEVNEVPVVDACRVGKVHVKYPLGLVGLGSPHLFHHYQQRTEACLVPFGVQQSAYCFKRRGLVAFGYAARKRHGQSEKAVAVAVLALARLEEAAQVAALLLTAEGAQRGYYFAVSVSHEYLP